MYVTPHIPISIFCGFILAIFSSFVYVTFWYFIWKISVPCFVWVVSKENLFWYPCGDVTAKNNFRYIHWNVSEISNACWLRRIYLGFTALGVHLIFSFLLSFFFVFFCWLILLTNNFSMKTIIILLAARFFYFNFRPSTPWIAFHTFC